MGVGCWTDWTEDYNTRRPALCHQTAETMLHILTDYFTRKVWHKVLREFSLQFIWSEPGDELLPRLDHAAEHARANKLRDYIP